MRCKLNTHILYEEYTIHWFEFNLCGLQHQQYTTDPTLDNNTGSERTFQRQEQIRDYSTGQYHATYHIVLITYWRCYLPDKHQERVQIHNILQELSQKQICVNYSLPVRQYSHRNIMNYFSNELFNTFRKRRVVIFIIMSLV